MMIQWGWLHAVWIWVIDLLWFHVPGPSFGGYEWMKLSATITYIPLSLRCWRQQFSSWIFAIFRTIDLKRTEWSSKCAYCTYTYIYINRPLLTVYTIYIHVFFAYYSTVCLQSIQCIDLHQRCASIQTLKKPGQRSPDPQRCQQWSLIKGMLISRERDMLVLLVSGGYAFFCAGWKPADFLLMIRWWECFCGLMITCNKD